MRCTAVSTTATKGVPGVALNRRLGSAARGCRGGARVSSTTALAVASSARLSGETLCSWAEGATSTAAEVLPQLTVVLLLGVRNTVSAVAPFKPLVAMRQVPSVPPPLAGVVKDARATAAAVGAA